MPGASQDRDEPHRAELRVVLGRADRHGLDPWRVAVALGIPAALRDALVEELRAQPPRVEGGPGQDARLGRAGAAGSLPSRDEAEAG